MSYHEPLISTIGSYDFGFERLNAYNEPKIIQELSKGIGNIFAVIGTSGVGKTFWVRHFFSNQKETSGKLFPITIDFSNKKLNNWVKNIFTEIKSKTEIDTISNEKRLSDFFENVIKYKVLLICDFLSKRESKPDFIDFKILNEKTKFEIVGKKLEEVKEIKMEKLVNNLKSNLPKSFNKVCLFVDEAQEIRKLWKSEKKLFEVGGNNSGPFSCFSSLIQNLVKYRSSSSKDTVGIFDFCVQCGTSMGIFEVSILGSGSSLKEIEDRGCTPKNLLGRVKTIIVTPDYFKFEEFEREFCGKFTLEKIFKDDKDKSLNFQSKVVSKIGRRSIDMITKMFRPRVLIEALKSRIIKKEKNIQTLLVENFDHLSNSLFERLEKNQKLLDSNIPDLVFHNLLCKQRSSLEVSRDQQNFLNFGTLLLLSASISKEYSNMEFGMEDVVGMDCLLKFYIQKKKNEVDLMKNFCGFNKNPSSCCLLWKKLLCLNGIGIIDNEIECMIDITHILMNEKTTTKDAVLLILSLDILREKTAFVFFHPDFPELGIIFRKRNESSENRIVYYTWFGDVNGGFLFEICCSTRKIREIFNFFERELKEQIKKIPINTNNLDLFKEFSKLSLHSNLRTLIMWNTHENIGGFKNSKSSGSKMMKFVENISNQWKEINFFGCSTKSMKVVISEFIEKVNNDGDMFVVEKNCFFVFQSHSKQKSNHIRFAGDEFILVSTFMMNLRNAVMIEYRKKYTKLEKVSKPVNVFFINHNCRKELKSVTSSLLPKIGPISKQEIFNCCVIYTTSFGSESLKFSNNFIQDSFLEAIICFIGDPIRISEFNRKFLRIRRELVKDFKGKKIFDDIFLKEIQMKPQPNNLFTFLINRLMNVDKDKDKFQFVNGKPQVLFINVKEKLENVDTGKICDMKKWCAADLNDICRDKTIAFTQKECSEISSDFVHGILVKFSHNHPEFQLFDNDREFSFDSKIGDSVIKIFNSEKKLKGEYEKLKSENVKLKSENEKLKADFNLKNVKLEADFNLKNVKLEADFNLNYEKLKADFNLKNEKLEKENSNKVIECLLAKIQIENLKKDINKLKEKLKIGVKGKVIDHDIIGKNDFIGACDVNLFTLATGPIHNKFTLKTHENTKGGVIEFDFIMKHMSSIKVVFRDIHVTEIDGDEETNVSLKFNPITDIKDVKSSESESVPFNHAVWGTVNPIIFDSVGLKKFRTQGVQIMLYKKGKIKRKELGCCSIGFERIFLKKNFEEVKIEKMIQSNEGENVGFLSLYLDFHHLPKFSQFVDGVDIDGKCVGTPLFSDSNVPENYVRNQQQKPIQRQQGVFVQQQVGKVYPNVQKNLYPQVKKQPSIEISLSPELAMFMKPKQVQQQPQMRQNTSNLMQNKFMQYHMSQTAKPQVDGYSSQPNVQNPNKFVQQYHVQQGQQRGQQRSSMYQPNARVNQLKAQPKRNSMSMYQTKQAKQVQPQQKRHSGYQQPQQQQYGNKFVQYSKQQPQRGNKFMQYTQKQQSAYPQNQQAYVKQNLQQRQVYSQQPQMYSQQKVQQQKVYSQQPVYGQNKFVKYSQQSQGVYQQPQQQQKYGVQQGQQVNYGQNLYQQAYQKHTQQQKQVYNQQQQRLNQLQQQKYIQQQQQLQQQKYNQQQNQLQQQKYNQQQQFQQPNQNQQGFNYQNKFTQFMNPK